LFTTPIAQSPVIGISRFPYRRSCAYHPSGDYQCRFQQSRSRQPAQISPIPCTGINTALTTTSHSRFGTWRFAIPPAAISSGFSFSDTLWTSDSVPTESHRFIGQFHYRVLDLGIFNSRTNFVYRQKIYFPFPHSELSSSL
jgi:hypothetical protein